LDQLLSDQPATFQAVSRRLVSDAVHDQLRRAILDGELPPGDALPPERALAERFGVNRHAVREALKRLQQARLVEVAHGGATTVLDWRETAGLDVLPDLVRGGGHLPSAGVLRSVLEMRLALGVDVARLCAQRAGAELAERLREPIDAGRAAAAGGAPLDVVAAHYDELWRRLIASSGNVAYRLAHNSLLDAIDRLPELAHGLSAAEIRDHARQAKLADAVARGDAAAAARHAHALLHRMLEASAGAVTTSRPAHG
jgi:GntR family transcriptional regulator, transcriptional repressor for pyruvate dehydrogenase complex